MATESQLATQIISLEGGLDFTTGKLTAQPGSLSDCYNFEVTDRIGYSRIMGNERYDGGFSPSAVYTNSIVLTHSAPTSPPVVPPRTPLYVTSAGGSTTIPFGYMVSLGTTSSVVVITDFVVASSLLIFLQNLATPTTVTIGALLGSGNPLSLTITGFSGNVGADAKATTILRNNQFKTLTNTVGKLTESPYNSPTIGLQLYKDQLYAVRSLNAIYFESGSTQPYANETLVSELDGSSSIKISRIELTSGAWADGDAVGIIYSYDDVVALGDTYGIPARTATNVLTVKGAQPDAELQSTQYAGMWRTFSDTQAEAAGVSVGWHPVDMGYELTFSGGTSSGPPLVYSRGEIQSSTDPIAAASVPTTVTSVSGSWTAAGGASTLLEAVTTDDQKYAKSTSILTNPVSLLQVKGFASADSVPAGAQITGLSLKISGAGIQSTTSNKTPYFEVRAISDTGELGAAPKASGQMRKVAGAFTSADIYQIGGPGDTWGIQNLAAELTNDFGFNLHPRALGTDSVSMEFQVNWVELTVYYTATTQGMYFWNGTNDVTAEVTNYYVDEGDWTTNDAHGYLQAASLTAVGAGTRNYIQAGDQIRTLPGGGGNLIATVESDAIGSVLPGLSMIEEQESRYRMITANFFSQESWEAIYGVSGAGRGFTYDGYYFRHLYTGLSPLLDMPRHVEFFQRHLIMGYKAGNIKISKVGTPDVYDVDLGGADIPTGDRVTGLIRMSGASLAIACQNSIQRLVGSSIDDFALQNLNPYDGAIEYTVVDCGKPVYCSTKGISFFEQTAAYGDFTGARLSAGIASWLTPRLEGRVPPINVFASGDKAETNYLNQAVSTGPLVAYPCRAKNQYRLVFKDGTMLTMTLQGPQMIPAFTIQSPTIYVYLEGTNPYAKGKFIPRAECSAIDSLGRERIFLSHYDAVNDYVTVALASSPTYYVYEFERSWTFDGEGIPSYFITTDNFKDSPFVYGKLVKIRVHGLSTGYAPCSLYVSKNYEAADILPSTGIELQDASLPKPPATVLSADLTPYTSMVNYSKDGWCFSMNFSNYVGSNNPYAIKTADPSPPYLLQTLLIQYVPSRGDL